MIDRIKLEELITLSHKHSAACELMGELTNETPVDTQIAVIDRFFKLTKELTTIGVELCNDQHLTRMFQSIHMVTPSARSLVKSDDFEERLNILLKDRVALIDLINKRLESAL